MKSGWLLGLVGLLACAACGSGGGVVPPTADTGRSALTLRPVPIYSPTPTPKPGLVDGLITAVSTLGCGLSGLTCHVVQGLAPQGLPAGTAASALVGLHPADLQSAYELPSAGAGSGQVIGIAVAYDNPNLESDLAVYRQTFGLPPCTTRNGCFKKIVPPGLLGLFTGNQGWGQESSIDVQVASAVCPNCKIVVVEAASEDPTALLMAAKTAVANGATVVSDSYSMSENAAENDAAYAIGVPFVFGSGDTGAGAQWPAASSHVIAVGGTSLQRDSSSPRGWSETVWNASGGGCSAYVAKPSWQHDGGCSHRATNDISAFADPDPGVAIYDSYVSNKPGWRSYGGTSVAAPIVAGAIALAGNGKSVLLDASYIYANASALNPVGGNNSAQAGNGSPRGVGAL